MRRWFQAALVLCVLAVAPAARAGWIVEGSVGKGVKVSPSPAAATQTNIMIAPGYTIIDILRLELGLVSDLPDIKSSKFNLQLRPMVVVAPPIFPLYGRAIFAVTNLLHGKTTIAYGAAAGLKFGVGPIGVFAEAGLLPRSTDYTDMAGMTSSKIDWVIEGRLGANLSF
jgi:hypothetical protein